MATLRISQPECELAASRDDHECRLIIWDDLSILEYASVQASRRQAATVGRIADPSVAGTGRIGNPSYVEMSHVPLVSFVAGTARVSSILRGLCELILLSGSRTEDPGVARPQSLDSLCRAFIQARLRESSYRNARREREL